MGGGPIPIVKIWLALLLLLTLHTIALGEEVAGTAPSVGAKKPSEDSLQGWEAAVPARTPPNGEAPPEPGEPEVSWADYSHAYVTDRAQALTEWMDSFFGDPNYDIEKPESLLRLEWANSWDEKDDEKSKLRLRGKLQLPAISKRLNLVFSGEDGDDLGDIVEDERESEDRVGLLYSMGERNRSRVDLTLGISTSELRPGIRYRNKGPIGERHRYRYTQRLQYEQDEGFFTTGQLNLDRAVREDTLLRWSNRAIYGEETKGVEWRSRVSLSRRLRATEKKRNTVITGYTSVKGFTDPSYTNNYSIGTLLRAQILRKYLFVELEPSYNWRKQNEIDDRDGVWNIVLRFEILLERDLRRVENGLDDG